MLSSEPQTVAGRFAPSPTGRMHLGNIYAALMSWLSAKSRGGRWILRIEDLDSGRSRPEYALLIEDDLRWLGLHPDEGGTSGRGPSGPYCQSLRGPVYEHYFKILSEKAPLYPCYCSRADLLAASAPHQSDGRVVYSGHCRPATFPAPTPDTGRRHAWRIAVPDRTIAFSDRFAGPQQFNLARDCGDFVVRRSDGSWAYQLAVVVDDALMGVTEVIRGNDLLLSAAQQIYLYELLGFKTPHFGHLPLLCNAEGQRLSKRDQSLSMASLRLKYTPEQLLGRLARLCIPQFTADSISLSELLAAYTELKAPLFQVKDHIVL